MIKRILFISILFINLIGFSQKNTQWKGYFSYNKISDITETENLFEASTENAILFKKNDDIGTINSIDGFKIDDITSIFYSKSKKITLVGNSKGMILLVNSEGKIFQKRGIIDEIPVSPLIKKINHFYEYQNLIYISCDFGITTFDLNTLEFGDTFYIGSGGLPVKVFQTTFFNNNLYAVTLTEGIKKASITNSNLIDYNQWQVFDNGNWNGITTFQNQLYLSNTNTSIHKYNGSSISFITYINQQIIDFRSSDTNLIITTSQSIHIFDQTLNQVATISNSQYPSLNDTFTCATVINNIVYIGTNNNGIITTSTSNTLSFESILPDGPIKNNIFRLANSSKSLWALYGSYSKDYNPYYSGPGQFPISKFIYNHGWDKIPYSNLLGARALSNIAFNPNNEKQFYVSSFFSGLLKVENETPTILYNNTNTGVNGLESLVLNPPNPAYIDIRINGPAFDKNGNIWMTNSRVTKGLKVLKSNGTWQSYDLSTIISGSINEDYALLQIDKNNTKWLPSYHNGVIAFNETMGNKSIVITIETNGNLPDTDVRSLAIDKKNQLWIGTNKGLRIIPNVDQFLTQTEIQTKNIVIEETIDGEVLAQELFYDQLILDIRVDGSNRKWFSIADSGVYLVSSDGQETIYHFTKENSPLPSNNVNDIEINDATGEVFFATENGLVSFKGSSTNPSDNLTNVYAYPNPVRPEYTGTVKVSGLTDKANIKITDIQGNLVFETTSAGGTIEWDTTAFGKYKVASGVYMIFVAAEDGIETMVKKVMIIR